MSKLKIFFLALGAAALCAVSFVVGYVAGFGYAVTEFNVDLGVPHGKYYVRLTDTMLIDVNDSEIELPEGTVLYYEHNLKTDVPRGACLEIMPIPRVFEEDKFEIIRKLETYESPREYFYSQSRE